MKHAALILLIVACLSPSAQACETLQVQDAWIRQAPPGAPTMAGYARITNKGSKPLQLTGISSADFAAAEVHESRMRDGQMRMRRLDPLTLAPGQTLNLAPAGDHLMLMRPVAAFSGQASTIEWHCGQQTSRTVFPVRKAP